MWLPTGELAKNTSILIAFSPHPMLSYFFVPAHQHPVAFVWIQEQASIPRPCNFNNLCFGIGEFFPHPLAAFPPSLWPKAQADALSDTLEAWWYFLDLNSPAFRDQLDIRAELYFNEFVICSFCVSKVLLEILVSLGKHHLVHCRWNTLSSQPSLVTEAVAGEERSLQDAKGWRIFLKRC